MATVFSVFLIVLACLLVATCLVVLTFSAVDIRRTGMAMASRLELLGERNYTVMSDTNEKVKHLEVKLDTLLSRVVPMDPEE